MKNDLIQKVKSIQENLNKLDQFRQDTSKYLTKITTVINTNEAKIKSIISRITGIQQKCDLALQVADEKVKKKFDPVKADIDSKIEEIKKVYKGEIIDTNVVENKVMKPLTLTKDKLQKFEEKINKIKKLVELVNKLNADLSKFNDILKNIKIPNIQSEFAVAIQQVDEMTSKVDNLLKTIKEIPNRIVQDFKNKNNFIIYAFTFGYFAF